MIHMYVCTLSTNRTTNASVTTSRCDGPDSDAPAAPRSQDEARLRYVEMGELAALEQIKRDSEALDRRSLAVGPFARLDAGAVAARDGKTRGVITHLFGSQAAYPGRDDGARTRRRRLDRAARVPARDFRRRRVGGGVLRRRVGARARARRAPEVDYAALWVLWLSTVPYGLWSERVSTPSMEEYVQSVEKLEGAFAEAISTSGRSCASP